MREIIPIDSNEYNGFSFFSRKPSMVFSRDFDGRLTRPKGFQIRGMAVLGRCLLEGHSSAQAAKYAGVNVDKASSFRSTLASLYGEIYCPCKRTSNHKGACRWRGNNPAVKLSVRQAIRSVKMRAAGMTLKTIADKFNVSLQAIHYLVKDKQ